MKAFSFLFLILISTFSWAEQKRVLGNWDVHYIAFNSTILTPEIALANDITRSPNQILINISILDRFSKVAQEVDISGQAKNLLGRNTPLSFKKVVEGDAIYYLASMKFSDEEHYRFTLDITQGSTQQVLKFEQKLYKEFD